MSKSMMITMKWSKNRN